MTETSPARFAFAPPLWLDEVASTNDYLKERVAAGDARAGDVVAARRQLRGKGRMGGSWQSSPKGDLTFSFYWRGNHPPVVAATLPMACALGVRDFLAAPPWRIASQCKWPNDVLADDAKICGILAEGGPSADGGMGLVVGIGVNLHRVPGRDAAIGRATAAIDDYHPDPGDPRELLPSLLHCLVPRIDAWTRGGFAAIRDDLAACLWGVGKTVAAKTPTGTVQGTVAGLGDDGGLLLESDGRAVTVASVTALDGWEPPAARLR